MNVGDYVRTKFGKIGKISNLTVGYSSELILCEENSIPFAKHQIIKSSPNIIDLIEVGDYVNGHKVFKKEEYQIRVEDRESTWGIAVLDETDIKSIVTKEQFESMKYEVE